MMWSGSLAVFFSFSADNFACFTLSPGFREPGRRDQNWTCMEKASIIFQDEI